MGQPRVEPFHQTGAADKNGACSAALEVALELVPCEAGSVLRGTINDSQLTFVAVSGPVGDQLLGRTVPFGEGLVGVAFDLGITVQVNDVARDQSNRAGNAGDVAQSPGSAAQCVRRRAATPGRADAS